MALFLMTLCLFSAGFHNAAVIVNPQDLAPKHSGSVFGIMNAFGAIPGNILSFCFFRSCAKFSFGCVFLYSGFVQ